MDEYTIAGSGLIMAAILFDAFNMMNNATLSSA
jgi:hypothetical protein